MLAKSNSNSKFFLYARKSSENEDRQVQSIEDQVNYLTELADTYNLEIVEILTESKSAKKPNCRPVFTDMISRIERGEADGILCWQINRLSRNPIESGILSWMLQQKVLNCIQTMDKQYLPDDNVLLFSVESGMANQYIIDLRKNCRRGMEGKATRGWMPACATIGYLNNKADNNIIPDPERFEMVRQMWDLMLSGNYTRQKIRRIANEQWGFRTLQRKKMGGGALSNSVMYKIFGNIFYTGMFKWAGKVYQGNHTPMVTMDEFYKVQDILGRKGSPRPQRHSFAYTGLIKCGNCDSMVTATEKQKFVKATGKHNHYVYYHCTRKKKQEIPCKNPPLTVSELESQIESELEKYTIAPEFLKWALPIIEEERKSDAAGADGIATTRQQSLLDIQKELSNLTRMRYKEQIDEDTFISESKNLKDQVTKLKALTVAKTSYSGKWIELTEKTFNFACYARERFENGGADQRREIFSAIGSNYHIKDKKLLFTASAWLIPIANDYSELYAEYRRLELRKDLDDKGRKAVLDSTFLRLSAIVEDVRIAINNKGDPGLHIPDFSVKANPP